MLIGPLIGAYCGPSLRLKPHRNAVATAIIGLSQAFTFRLGDEAPQRTRFALAPAGALHGVDADGAMLFVYLDAADPTVARLSQTLTPSTEATCSAWADLLARAPASLAGLKDAVGQLFGEREERAPCDPVIADVAQAIAADPATFVGVAVAARRAGLTQAQFQRRFSRAMGMPFRRYRLWRRMAVALMAMSRGTSLTHAAFDAGFSSSAHLSAAFMTMFGLAPSALLKSGVQIRLE